MWTFPALEPITSLSSDSLDVSGDILSLCWAPDDRTVAGVTSNGDVLLWHVGGAKLLYHLRISSPNHVSGRGPSKSRYRSLVMLTNTPPSNKSAHDVRTIDDQSDKVAAEIIERHRPVDSSSLTLLLLESSRTEGSYLSIWNTNQIVTRTKVSRSPGTCLTYDSASGYAAVGCFGDSGEVVVCSVTSSSISIRQRITRAHSFFISSVSIERDMVASGSGDGTVLVSYIRPSSSLMTTSRMYIIAVILSFLMFLLYGISRM